MTLQDAPQKDPDQRELITETRRAGGITFLRPEFRGAQLGARVTSRLSRQSEQTPYCLMHAPDRATFTAARCPVEGSIPSARARHRSQRGRPPFAIRNAATRSLAIMWSAHRSGGDSSESSGSLESRRSDQLGRVRERVRRKADYSARGPPRRSCWSLRRPSLSVGRDPSPQPRAENRELLLLHVAEDRHELSEPPGIRRIHPLDQAPSVLGCRHHDDAASVVAAPLGAGHTVLPPELPAAHAPA